MIRSPVAAAGLSIAFGLLLVACIGPTGGQGQNGAEGTPGDAGINGPGGVKGLKGLIGPPGDAGVTTPGGIKVGCLAPCHGFDGIVEQFKTSAHYTAYIANAGGDEADTWTTPGQACGNCHAADGLKQRLAADVGTQGDAGVANVVNGELGYLNTDTGQVAEATYTGGALVAAVACQTCHVDVTAATDPHKTGVNWTEGSFPIRVPQGANDKVFIEKSAAVGTVTGTSIGTYGLSNTCVFCHRSRKDVTNYITATNTISSTHWGPHEGPQADLFSAKGGYEFAGLSYGTGTHPTKLTCIDCHMPKLASNENTRNHSFRAQLSACQQCHAGTKTFNVAGGQTVGKLALFELQLALNKAGYLTRSAAPPYLPLQPSELADGSFELDQAMPTTPPAVPLTAEQAGALYDYLVVARDGTKGLHNPMYAQQLLYDAYFAVTLQASKVIVPRP